MDESSNIEIEERVTGDIISFKRVERLQLLLRQALTLLQLIALARLICADRLLRVVSFNVLSGEALG